MSAAAANNATSKRGICLLCRIPLLVLLATMGGAYAWGTVAHYRINATEKKIERNDGRIDTMQLQVAEIIFIKQAVMRIEAKTDALEKKIDRIIQEQGGMAY